jgi:16S rRNA (cytidine1402-2'-O)-methyltransferase
MMESSRRSANSGILYIVATPIGNLADLSSRAVEVLGSVDLIAAEDTRHSGKLMQFCSIQTPLQSLHEHNERELAPRLVEDMLSGRSIALISDAGTPLISDPGFKLVRLARQAAVQVVPIPGPSALICALSASGLPTDRFVFEGFLPAKRSARRNRLEQLGGETRSLVFFESSHRIVDCLRDCEAVFGAQRQAVVARELTKQFETIHGDTLEKLAQWVSGDPNQQRGEIVLLVQGRTETESHQVTPEAERILLMLLDELPLKKAAKLAARMTGVNKRALYERALHLKETRRDQVSD